MIKSNVRHIEFGKGDIGIYMGDTSDVALLVFRNLKLLFQLGIWLVGMKNGMSSCK